MRTVREQRFLWQNRIAGRCQHIRFGGFPRLLLAAPDYRRNGKTKTIPYNVAEQLRTPEEMAAYLDAWLAEAPEDAAGFARALGDIARAKGMSQVARDAGLSRESCG